MAQGGQPSGSDLTNVQTSIDTLAEALVGSPLKKARPSIDQTNAGDRYSATQSLSAALGSIVSGTPEPPKIEATTTPKVEEEEEL